MAAFTAIFETDGAFAAAFSTTNAFSVGFEDKINVSEYDTYDGDYVITTGLTDRSLATNGLLMDEDVTVKGVKVTYTSNMYGGKTVVIG